MRFGVAKLNTIWVMFDTHIPLFAAESLSSLTGQTLPPNC